MSPKLRPLLAPAQTHQRHRGEMSRILVNPLGDIRAEADHQMLSTAFYETPDYLTLLESEEKVVVVGRRGTGKSAITYKLNKQWKEQRLGALVVVSPDEHHMLALLPLIAKAGETFTQVRGASRLLWRYGLMLEVAQQLSVRFKVKELVAQRECLSSHLRDWGKPDQSFFDKLRHKYKKVITSATPKDEIISSLSDAFEIGSIERDLRSVLNGPLRAHILIDRLDEGFEPDKSSVAFIDGAVTAAIDLSTAFKGHIKPLVFLRDNIFRAVAHYDQDFTRNIEGQALRLHWDVNNLFYLVCNRIRAAFTDDTENNKRLWNRYVAHDLQAEDGFRQCLKFTLYRPRDILILLNSAFENASKRDLTATRTTISFVDLEKSAKTISENRLDDLCKEYRHIFPSIEQSISIFSSRSPEISYLEACELLSALSLKKPTSIDAAVDQAIFSRPEDYVRALYGVGFFGVYDQASGSYVFSHDGRNPESDITQDKRMLIHPCYWMALNLTKSTLNPEEATEINDEYEIKVSSITPEIRSARLGRLITEYNTIPEGAEGAGDFENWCLEALKICFAGRLDNIALHPNKDSVNRRDLVGTNLAQTTFWKRVEKDYNSRQVIFEVKNYTSPTLDDYRQLQAYMSGAYGNISFLICRHWSVNLESDSKDLAWIKSIHSDHKKVVVKLTAKFIADILSKLRNPRKHDAGDNALGTLLDTYERLYFGQQSARPKAKGGPRR